MKKLLSTVATGITFPPELVVNERRQGLFDVFDGGAKKHYNDFFKYASLNATWVDSPTSGDCYVNGTCSGVIETLRTGRADFAIFPTAIDFPPGFNITCDYPVYVGPMVDEVGVGFLSMPYQRAYKLNKDILANLETISGLVGLLNIIMFITVFILFNVSFRARRNRVTFRLRKNFSWINVYALFSKQVMLPARRLRYSMCIAIALFHAFFMTAAFSGFFQSNMIYEHPAKYYTSLEEIVERVHNKSVMTVEGLVVDSKLIHLEGSIFQRMSRIAKTHKREETFGLGEKVVNGHILVAVMGIVELVHAISCLDKENYFLLRVSEPAYRTVSYLLSSPNVSSHLKERYTRVSLLHFEADLYRHQSAKKVIGNDDFAFYRCLLRDSVVKLPFATFNSFSHMHFKSLFRLLQYNYLIIFIVNICELALGISPLPWSAERENKNTRSRTRERGHFRSLR